MLRFSPELTGAPSSIYSRENHYRDTAVNRMKAPNEEEPDSNLVGDYSPVALSGGGCHEVRTSRRAPYTREFQRVVTRPQVAVLHSQGHSRMSPGCPPTCPPRCRRLGSCNISTFEHRHHGSYKTVQDLGTAILDPMRFHKMPP